MMGRPLGKAKPLLGLLALAQFASQYFGQDSHGLVHKEIPLGRVDIGEIKSLGQVPAK
jgi:hypothetical protein